MAMINLAFDGDVRLNGSEIGIITSSIHCSINELSEQLRTQTERLEKLTDKTERFMLMNEIDNTRCEITRRNELTQKLITTTK